MIVPPRPTRTYARAIERERATARVEAMAAAVAPAVIASVPYTTNPLSIGKRIASIAAAIIEASDAQTGRKGSTE